MSTSRASQASGGHLGPGAARRPAPASAGRAARSSAGRRPAAPRCGRPRRGTAAGRRRRPAARRPPRPRACSRRTVAVVTSGMSTASTTTRRGARGKPCSPASSPAAGPPPGGSSRRNVTGRLVTTSSPTTTTSGTSASAPSTCSSRVAPPTSMEALSAPWKRTAVPPVSTIPPSSGRSTFAVWHPGWQSGAPWTAPPTRSACGSCSAPPASTRPRTAPRSTSSPPSCPAETDLVVLPEAFARDFGEPGSDLAPFAEPLDGPFAAHAAQAGRRDGDGLAGRHVRDRRRPGPAAEHARARRRRRSDVAYRKIHLYDSFGYHESDDHQPGRDRAGRAPTSAASRSG